MKKQNLALLILSSTLLLGSCVSNGSDKTTSSSDNESQKETITLNKKSFSLAPGQTFQLTSSKEGVSYSSSDASVATVDSNGLVKAISLGSAIITASLGDIQGLAKVTVTDELISTLSINFATSSVALYSGESVALSPAVKFGDETIDNANIEYGSADEDVVTYADGKVTAKKEGSASIYAKVSYDGYSDVAYVSVEVLSLKTRILPEFKERNVVVGEEGLDLSFALLKGDDEIVGTHSYAYSLSDETLAEVDGNVLKGKKKGKVDLVVSTIYEGETVSLTISFVVNEWINLDFYSEGVLFETHKILNGNSFGENVGTPELSGYQFAGYVDQNGDSFTKDSIYDDSTSFEARWLAITGKIDGARGTLVKGFYSIDEFICPQKGQDGFGYYSCNEKGDAKLEEGEYAFNLQVSGVNDYDITLPAFDFVSAGRVDFYFSENYGEWDVLRINGAEYVFNANTVIVTVAANGDGTASLYLNDVIFTTLDTAVSNGEEGMKLTFTRDSEHTYQSFYIGPFMSYVYDYRTKLNDLVSSLPADPSALSDDESIALFKGYAEAVSYLTPYETIHYSEPAKVMALKNAIKGKTTSLFTIPEERNWTSVRAIGIDTDGKGFSNNGGSEYMGINFQSGGISDGITQYVKFPKINYALYSSVDFKIMHNYTGASVKVGESELITFNVKDTWVDVTIAKNSDGKMAITCGTTSIVLSDEVANGKANLRFDVTRDRSLSGMYDTFTFTKFVATF